MKAAVTSLAVALLLSGCASSWPTPRLSFYHAASVADAKREIASRPKMAGSVLAPVAYTGSMKPHLRGGELVLLEPYIGQQLAAGDVVSFDRGDAPNCLHMVADVKGSHVYMTGTNNRYSDGWFHVSKINWICRAAVTMPR